MKNRISRLVLLLLVLITGCSQKTDSVSEAEPAYKIYYLNLSY